MDGPMPDTAGPAFLSGIDWKCTSCGANDGTCECWVECGNGHTFGSTFRACPTCRDDAIGNAAAKVILESLEWAKSVRKKKRLTHAEGALLLVLEDYEKAEAAYSEWMERDKAHSAGLLFGGDS